MKLPPRIDSMIVLHSGLIITSLSTRILELRHDHVREFVLQGTRWTLGRWWPRSAVKITAMRKEPTP